MRFLGLVQISTGIVAKKTIKILAEEQTQKSSLVWKSSEQRILSGRDYIDLKNQEIVIFQIKNDKVVQLQRATDYVLQRISKLKELRRERENLHDQIRIMQEVTQKRGKDYQRRANQSDDASGHLRSKRETIQQQLAEFKEGIEQKQQTLERTKYLNKLKTRRLTDKTKELQLEGEGANHSIIQEAKSEAVESLKTEVQSRLLEVMQLQEEKIAALQKASQIVPYKIIQSGNTQLAEYKQTWMHQLTELNARFYATALYADTRKEIEDLQYLWSLGLHDLTKLAGQRATKAESLEEYQDELIKEAKEEEDQARSDLLWKTLHPQQEKLKSIRRDLLRAKKVLGIRQRDSKYSTEIRMLSALGHLQEQGSNQKLVTERKVVMLDKGKVTELTSSVDRVVEIVRQQRRRVSELKLVVKRSEIAL